MTTNGNYVPRNVDLFLEENLGCVKNPDEVKLAARTIAAKQNIAVSHKGLLSRHDIERLFNFDHNLTDKFVRDVENDSRHQKIFEEDTGSHETAGNRGGQGIQTHPEALPQEHPTDTGQQHP